MAQYVNLIARCLILSWLFVSYRIAAADAVARDPTLPPLSISAPAVSNSTSAPPVQFISIHGNQRKAIVRGVTVKVGDRITEGRITGITGHGIWVKSDDGSSELQLFPDVDKHSHASNPSSSSRGTQR